MNFYILLSNKPSACEGVDETNFSLTSLPSVILYKFPQTERVLYTNIKLHTTNESQIHRSFTDPSFTLRVYFLTSIPTHNNLQSTISHMMSKSQIRRSLLVKSLVQLVQHTFENAGRREVEASTFS